MQFLCRMMESRAFPVAILLAALLSAAHPALAEKADRGKAMVVDADKPGSVDLQRHVAVFSGNVLISQGTMTLRAERIEVREAADGQRLALAEGTPQVPATYRQKRDVPNEWVEGSADRIEYDTRSDTLKFIGRASVRRLRGGEVADEITGGSITWDNKGDLFSVSGGAASPANPGGRVRAVLAPRAAASAPPGEPAALKPARALGDGQ
jgi:lipopolysaccharide export system protein LptA